MQIPGSLDSFPRSARFIFRRRLGAGGFGVVYEADDLERGTRVALKTLQHLDAAGLYAFKREFRALADLAHPNLIALHELISEGDQWFFTMDLVEGTDFFSFVRGSLVVAAESTVVAPWMNPQSSMEVAGFVSSTQNAPDPATPPAEHTPAPIVRVAPVESPGTVDPKRWTRLRSALRQLAEGLNALHAAGKLHRDLKPSNVLITCAGKLTILDFGLVMDVLTGTAQSSVMPMAGTPGYMAPEQALGEPASPANDWYSVGVMLYEALTGKLPFEGNAFQVLMRKQREDPLPPSAADPSVPGDLDTLCVQLLSRIPGERPSGADVLHRVMPASEEADDPPPHRSLLPESMPFVGRERHLAVLSDAFARVKEGWATTVHVRGVSGIGKSALVRHFLEGLASRQEVVILTGRCYEREAVPYKAVDSLIDSLSRHLSRLPEPDVAALLPRDVQAVVRLFPVLDRVNAIAAAPRRDALPPDVQELRRRGFNALRELLARIADRKPLVLHIDDLQWGDADSAFLLAEILREPEPPALLLLIGYRSEDAEKSEMLRRLPAPAVITSKADINESVRDLLVGELDREESRAMALSVLGDSYGAASQADMIAEEAAGSPFFVRELSHWVRSQQKAEAGEIRLETTLANRLSRLPADARCLLETVSVSGRPLARRVARAAAALSPEQERAAIALLRVEYILRSRGVGDEEELETFHDRIRETSLAQLNAKELAQRHLQVVGALEASGKSDPDTLAMHFRRAERPDKAAPYAILAGDRAAAALAFDRAAALFAYALEAAPGDPTHERDLRIKLGDALRNAGRGAEAAREYSSAAKGAPPRQNLELRRQAAEQLLRSGHVEEGKLALHDVLASVGITVFQSRWMVLASLLFRRLLIQLYSFGLRRKAGEVSAETLVRLHVYAVGIGLSATDPLRGSEFHARHFLLALQAGDRYHLAVSFAIEVAHAAMDDKGGRRRALRAHRIAEELANEVGDPYLLGLSKWGMALLEGLTGYWSKSLAYFQEAEEIWSGRCTGIAWELALARVFVLSAHFHRGDFQEISRLTYAVREDAVARGDLFALTYLRVGMLYVVSLARDRPDAAREEVLNAISNWSQRDFDALHFWEMVALGRIDIYAGTPLAARQRMKNLWPKILRSFLLMAQYQRVSFYHLRASSALAAASMGGKDGPLFQTLLREADRDIRRLAREDVPWAQALSDSLRAPLASLRGDTVGAMSFLERAASRFDACEMALFAASVRRRHGEIIGGDVGRAMVAAADTWMAGQGIQNPGRMTCLFAPGFR